VSNIPKPRQIYTRVVDYGAASFSRPLSQVINDLTTIYEGLSEEAKQTAVVKYKYIYDIDARYSESSEIVISFTHTQTPAELEEEQRVLRERELAQRRERDKAREAHDRREFIRLSKKFKKENPHA
jgi:hypothetical protein